MATKLNKGVIYSVGATHSPELIELMGAGFAYVTPDTERGPGLKLSVGNKVLVDYRSEIVDFGRGNKGFLALKVRNYGPHAADVAELEEFLARLARAGVPDPGFGNASAFVNQLFNRRISSGTTTPIDYVRELVSFFMAKELRFPLQDLQDEADSACEEMEEHLAKLGVKVTLPRPDFDDELDEEDARAEVIAEIAEAANDALAKSRRDERWHQFASLDWDGNDPLWLLLTPAQRDGLVREKILDAP